MPIMKGNGASKAVAIDLGIKGTNTCIQTNGKIKLVKPTANE